MTLQTIAVLALAAVLFAAAFVLASKFRHKLAPALTQKVIASGEAPVTAADPRLIYAGPSLAAAKAAFYAPNAPQPSPAVGEFAVYETPTHIEFHKNGELHSRRPIA